MKKILKTIVITILTIEARLVLWRHKPKIIVVTGTVGKTTTKDAIFAIFSKFFYARKSEKSFNSDIGVPLSILDLKNGWNSPLAWIKNIFFGFEYLVLPSRYPGWLILEVGTDRPGDIQKISRWLKPDIVVATRFADIPVHVEFFDSPQDVIKEEQSIAHALKKDGVLIVNNDDPYATALKKALSCKSISFGMSEKAGVRATRLETLYADSSTDDTEKENRKPIGIRFRSDYEEMSGPVSIDGVLGVQHVYPVLAALAVGISQGLNIIKMSQELEDYATPPGRMRLIEGRKDSTIIDDTYNSSPVACERALEAIAGLEVSGRKIAILGDMRELGSYAHKEHQRIGVLAGKCVDVLVCVGEHSGDFSRGAFTTDIKKENVYEFDKATQASAFILEHLKEDDVVLVKGSQSVHLERVVEALMAHPEQKEKLLARQEKEWLE